MSQPWVLAGPQQAVTAHMVLTSRFSPVVSATWRMMLCTILDLLNLSSHCWMSSGDTRL
jgi:hypothetical protein